MQVTLLHQASLKVCSYAIRTCWDSHDKSDNGGEIDKSLIHKVGNINKHKSVLEHLIYTFDIQGISRACLQELARHRIASLSVKSTRYTLKELNKEVSFLPATIYNRDRASKYLVLDILNNERMYIQALQALENLRLAVQGGIGNDKAKYLMPECYKTSLVWTINARSLQNFLELRSDKRALQEIRKLAIKVYEALPDEHKYVFKECIKDAKDEHKYVKECIKKDAKDEHKYVKECIKKDAKDKYVPVLDCDDSSVVIFTVCAVAVCILILVLHSGCARRVVYTEVYIPTKCDILMPAKPILKGDLSIDIAQSLEYSEILEKDLQFCIENTSKD